MPSYAAFIGHQPHISLAELSATAPGFKLRGVFQRTVALFESSADLDQQYLNGLGGTVVLARGLEPMPKDAEAIPELLLKELEDVKGKTTFSLRTVGVQPRVVGKLYRTCKDFLRSKGRSSRYVGNERTPAPSVVLHENNLIDKTGGCEIVILEDKEFFWAGVTVGAQNVNAYTFRDTQKPVRDTTVGLLPPKLAQTLLNFGLWLKPPVMAAGAEVAAATAGKVTATKEEKAKAKEKAKKKAAAVPLAPYTVFDPFCGTGVIPIECLLRGFRVLASDKSEKAVTGTQKNVEWLRRKFDLKKTDLPSAVWKQDATKPFDFEKVKVPSRPDVVVTETSLGPNLKSRPTVKDAQSLRSENEKIQEGFLKAAAASLLGVPLVCTWPVWYCSKGVVMLERVWKMVDKYGYEAVLPPGIQPLGERRSLVYRRPEQFVGREIVLLRPRK